MAYPANFLHVVFGGTLYDDTWNTGFNVINANESLGYNMPNLTDANVVTLANLIPSAFGSVALAMNGSATIKFFKINEIGPDGRYISNITHEYIYPTAGAGGGPGGIPAQLSTVVSLRTFQDRGLASKGRMYLPACQGFESVDTTGRASTAAAERVANRIAVFLNTFHATINAFPQFSGTDKASVGIVSKARSGANHVVTNVTVGRVPDTMRSRRNKLTEAPVPATTVVTPV